MSIKNWIKSKMNSLPYVRALYKENIRWQKNSAYPPGHFYSPIVNADEIKNKEAVLWQDPLPDSVPEIQMNLLKQKELLKSFEEFYPSIPFKDDPEPPLRYHYKNTFYSYTDAIVLHCMMRHLKPKRIIEMGSGFTSALMLDTNEQFFDNSIQLTFIEPYPKRLNSLLTGKDSKSCTIIEKFAQDIPLSNFKKLEAGDILFVDSTHVSKTGSDVNYILFEILPALNKGVYIHFHDIFYPFEYPKKWVYGGRNWNEVYAVRAFLMYNASFEIVLFSHFMHKKHKEAFSEMPLTYNNTGGNLWLCKK